MSNKIDKEGREMSRKEGMIWARVHNTLSIEANAKTKKDVECAFEELLEKIIQVHFQINRPTPGIAPGEEKQLLRGVLRQVGQSGRGADQLAGFKCLQSGVHAPIVANVLTQP